MKKFFLTSSLIIILVISIAGIWSIVSGGYDRQNKVILLIKKMTKREEGVKNGQNCLTISKAGQIPQPFPADAAPPSGHILALSFDLH